MPYGPGLMTSASKPLWGHPDACSPLISKPRRCCGLAPAVPSGRGHLPRAASLVRLGHMARCSSTPLGHRSIEADAVVLALGGASWPQLGSTGEWVPLLAERGVPLAPLRPSNCGFDVGWSEHFRTKFAGHPVKTVGVVAKKPDGVVIRRLVSS